MYTEELMERIISEYNLDPTRETVDRLAEEIGKSPRSVIAKLTNAGVYKKPAKLSKTGDLVVKKETLATEIGEWFGIEVPSLSKAAKLELKALHSALSDPVSIRAHLVDLEYTDD